MDTAYGEVTGEENVSDIYHYMISSIFLTRSSHSETRFYFIQTHFLSFLLISAADSSRLCCDSFIQNRSCRHIYAWLNYSISQELLIDMQRRAGPGFNASTI